MAARWRRRAAAVLTALLALVVASVGLAGSASAHAQLVGSNPADGTTIQSSPAQLRIDLTQAVFPDKTTLTVTDSSGRSIPVGAIAVVVTGAGPGDPGLVARAGSQGLPTSILADIPALKPEVYRASWSTLSTDDLHATSGVIVFGVQRAVGHQAGQVSDPLPPPGELGVRALLLLAAAVAVGAGAVLVLLGDAEGAGNAEDEAAGGAADGGDLPAVRRRLLGVAAVSSGLAAVLGVVLLLVQADVLSAGLAFAADVLSSPAFLLRWAGRELAALVSGAAFAVAWRRTAPGTRTGLLRTGLPLLGVFAATTALMGHTGSGSRALDVVAHAAHVAAALVWVGTVVTALLLLGPRRVRREALGDRAIRRLVLSRFGLVGLACLLMIIASGLVLMGAGTVSLDALLLSTYGRIVLLKIVALLVAAGAAAALTMTLHPSLVPARWRPRVASAGHRRLFAVEALVLVGAIVLGATAAGARPALGTEWTPTSAAPPIVAQEVSDLVETVKVGPNAPGRNFVTVNVFETRRPSPGPVTGVDVAVRRPGGAAVPVTLSAQGQAGVWLAATDAFDEPRPWSLTVTVHRDGLPDVTAGYDWLVADPSARLATPLVSSAPYQSLLDAAAAVVAIVGAALLLGLVLARRRRRGGDGRGVGSPGDGPAGRTAGAGATGELVDEVAAR